MADEGIPIVTDPFDQFNNWFAKANSHPEIKLPNAFCLATSSSNGIPSTRMVLMREFSKEGLLFSSSTESKKGKDLKENPNAAGNFFWLPLFQQVRVEGKVEIVYELSDKLWDTSDPELKLSICLFTQGEEIGTRQAFLKRREEAKAKFMDKPIPKPVDYVAYRLKPTLFEFYESNVMKTSDRIEYKWNEEKKEWSARRLAV